MIANSLTISNTWFLFRENGVEVKINIEGKYLHSTYELSLAEQKRVELEILPARSSLVKTSPYETKYLITN